MQERGRNVGLSTVADQLINGRWNSGNRAIYWWPFDNGVLAGLNDFQRRPRGTSNDYNHTAYVHLS